MPRSRRRKTGAALALTLTLLTSVPAAAGNPDLGINVFGFSHHFKNPFNENLREVNPGLGLSWTFVRSERGSMDLNGGVYQDSFGHANTHLALGGRVRVAGPISLGLQMINASSASFNHNEPVLTPYPFLAAQLRDVTLNLAYIPEVKSVNGMPSLATFVTVHPWRRSAADASEAAPAGAGSALEFTITRLAALEGFDARGFQWRRMFDDQHGLRLGFRINGQLYSRTERGVHYGPDGSYEGALLVQYLNRCAARDRWRPYWATGLEIGFAAGNSVETVTESWRSDLGVEYALGRGLALALEYGVAVRYRWQDGWTAAEYSRPEERSWSFADTGPRLMLVATRGPAAPAGQAAALWRPVSGPVVMFGPDLEPQAFDQAAIAWQWQPTPTLARRLAVDVQSGVSQQDLDRQESHAFQLRAERLSRRPGDGAVTTYWGWGPTAGFRYTRNHYVYDDGSSGNSIWRTISLGLTGLVGAEFPLTAGVQVLAEYSADLQWALSTGRSDSRYQSWFVDTDGVRLGASVLF